MDNSDLKETLIRLLNQQLRKQKKLGYYTDHKENRLILFEYADIGQIIIFVIPFGEIQKMIAQNSASKSMAAESPKRS